MHNKFIYSLFLFLILPLTSVFNQTVDAIPAYVDDFSYMTKLWCTVDYKHWATSYYNQVGYDEFDFYLYLDEANKKIYNEHKEEIEKVLEFADKHIKFINTYHRDKRTITENYTLDRYTGRAKGSGTIRHDYGKWASITYENRDFDAKGQCAKVSEQKKF